MVNLISFKASDILFYALVLSRMKWSRLPDRKTDVIHEVLA